MFYKEENVICNTKNIFRKTELAKEVRDHRKCSGRILSDLPLVPRLVQLIFKYGLLLMRKFVSSALRTPVL